MHYLITGHTGFKGAWLSLLLKSRGHKVSGLSLEPSDGSLFTSAGVSQVLENHVIQDIRDRSLVTSLISSIAPDRVVHMAAQPLVLKSYEDPVDTFDTNVAGTLNVLIGCSNAKSVQEVLVVTTDKVYANDGRGAFVEKSALGGRDPYSASKAMADMLAQSWINLESHYELGIARAGNVIGFGDISESRIVPDLTRGLSTGSTVEIRNPDAVRPWQHVLDCLNGYLLFLDSMSEPRFGDTRVLNFGPSLESLKTVRDLVKQVAILHPHLRTAEVQTSTKKQETDFLTLDSSAARQLLGWRDRLPFDKAVEWSIPGGQPDPRALVTQQILEFENHK